MILRYRRTINGKTIDIENVTFFSRYYNKKQDKNFIDIYTDTNIFTLEADDIKYFSISENGIDRKANIH